MPYAIGGAIVLALLAAIPPQPHEASSSETVAKATLLPQISVTAKEQDAVIIEPAAPKVAPAAKTTTLAMNNAQALPPREVLAQLPAPAADKMTDESKGKTINLQGKNESIVGQMARIPLENEQITEIKSVSDIDNSAGRELLSIINKY